MVSKLGLHFMQGHDTQLNDIQHDTQHYEIQNNNK